MIFSRFIFILIFLFSGLLIAADKDVDTLFEKVNQAKNSEEKKELIEELKLKLAKRNKKHREKADAIIKAKQKIPQKIYNASTLKSKYKNE